MGSVSGHWIAQAWNEGISGERVENVIDKVGLYAHCRRHRGDSGFIVAPQASGERQNEKSRVNRKVRSGSKASVGCKLPMWRRLGVAGGQSISGGRRVQIFLVTRCADARLGRKQLARWATAHGLWPGQCDSNPNPTPHEISTSSPHKPCAISPQTRRPAPCSLNIALSLHRSIHTTPLIYSHHITVRTHKASHLSIPAVTFSNEKWNQLPALHLHRRPIHIRCGL